MANQVACRCATEGLSPPQIRQRLQKTRLSGGVRTVDQVELGIELQLSVFQAAKIANPETANHVDLSPMLKSPPA